MKLRAISLHQPWASLVGRGKSIETRGWETDYRGPLAIHAALTFPESAGRLCLTEPFKSALSGFPQRPFVRANFNVPSVPFGAIVAVCNLTAIYPIEEAQRSLFVASGYREERDGLYVSEKEWAFGDYSAGRFAWLLKDIYILPELIPMVGRQRFWTIELFSPEITRRFMAEGEADT